MDPTPRAPRKKMVCIGFDAQHPDFGPLTGAVEDARRWSSFASERLDFEVRLVTHEDLPRPGFRHGLNLLQLLDEEVSDLAPGDLFGLFLATHGKELQFKGNKSERVFTLPGTSNAVINDFVHDPDNKRFDTGGLFVTLSQLESITARPGLQRFFVLDTCRSVVDLSLPTADRKGEREAFAGETIDRQMVLRIRRKSRAEQSPLTTVNSCSDGQVAKELKQERGGVFTLSAIEVLRARHKAHQPLRFDEPFIADVQAEMRATAQRLQADLNDQRPALHGQAVELWSLSHTQRAQLNRLLPTFESQLQAGTLEAPAGACARDTLAQIRALDIPQEEKDTLQQRLAAAIDEDRQRRDLAHDEARLAIARASDTLDHWNAVLYSARLEASRQVAQEALQRLRHAAEDDEAWRAALTMRTAATVSRYLDRFGEAARHHADALDLLAQLQREEDERAEREAWRRAQQDDKPQAYRDFIAAWPASLWLSQARTRLQDLERQQGADQAEAAAWAALDAAAPLPATEAGFQQRLAALRAYGERFPQSQRPWEFCQLQLQEGLQRLREDAAHQAAEAATRRQQQEQADWQDAQGADTPAAYTRYRRQWPEGSHAVEALARIAELERRAKAAQAAEQARRRAEAAYAAIAALRPTTRAQLEAAMAQASAFLTGEFGTSTHAAAVTERMDAWVQASAALQQAEQEAQAWQTLQSGRAAAKPANLAQAQTRLQALEQHLRTWPQGATAAQAATQIASLRQHIRALEQQPDASWPFAPPAPPPPSPPPPPPPAPRPKRTGHQGQAESTAAGAADPALRRKQRQLALAGGGAALLAAVGWLALGGDDPPPPPPAPAPVVAEMPAPPPNLQPLLGASLAPQQVLARLAPEPAEKMAALPTLPPDQLATVQAAWRTPADASRLPAADLLLRAGAATLGWPQQAVAPAQAMGHYLQWLARLGAGAPADERQAVETIVTLLLARTPSPDAPAADWPAQVQALGNSALAPLGLPLDYWRGAIQYCLLNPPDPAAARASFTAAARQPAAAGETVATYASVSSTMLNDYLNRGKTCAQMNAEYGKR